MVSASVVAEREILGCNTQVLIQTFSDRILVLVTQLGKIGSLVQASLSSAAPMIPALPPLPGEEADDILPEPSASIQLSPLFGAPPPVFGDSLEDAQVLQNIYVSQIATVVWTADSMTIGLPVVVGLALKRAAGNAVDSEQERRERFLSVARLVRACMQQRDAGSV
ncbi:hypothetical protein BKA62DRAFT_507627 [Auriculariales sp. MPI-PUGE-AT-0066]|nr:hypothetical protein BKA62DRAFT_507627 [Auriculariales sp. MPI-PUGE-AT-0066]